MVKKQTASSSNSTEFITNMTEKAGKEVKQMETKIKHLSVNKKFVFFTGIALVVSSFLVYVELYSLGAMITFLIGASMIYVGITAKNPITDLNEKGGK